MNEKEWKQPRGVCPICDKELTASYVADHMRLRHNIRGGQTGKIKRTANEIQKGVTLEEIRRRAERCARPERESTSSPGPVEYHRPDEVAFAAGPSMPLVQQPIRKTEVRVVTVPKPITRVANMEVVTDGERIGIVEWQAND